MIEAQPLDIQASDLYSRYSYDYPMVELQETLFRYSTDLEKTSNSGNELVVLPLSRGAKISINCHYCNKSKVIYKHKLKYSKYKFCNKDCQIKWQKHSYKLDNSDILKNRSKRWLKKSFDKYKHIQISEEANQILLGSLLGDGCLYKQNCSQYWEGHSVKQKDYLIWKFQILNLPSYKMRFQKQKGYEAYHLQTKYLPQLNKYYDMFYPNDKKVITKEILDQLNLLGLAVWYMDDGSIYYKNKYKIFKGGD